MGCRVWLWVSNLLKIYSSTWLNITMLSFLPLSSRRNVNLKSLFRCASAHNWSTRESTGEVQPQILGNCWRLVVRRFVHRVHPLRPFLPFQPCLHLAQQRHQHLQPRVMTTYHRDRNSLRLLRKTMIARRQSQRRLFKFLPLPPHR